MAHPAPGSAYQVSTAPNGVTARMTLGDRGVLRLFAEPGPPGGVTLAALSVDDLRALFTGAELVLHLPSDAARLLHRRTAGVPSRVVGEVESWVSLGLARWVGDRLRVDRPTLDRLLAAPVDIPSGGARVSGSDVTDDEPELREHLGWLALAGPRVPARVVQAAMGVPAWAFEAGLRELEARGWARSLEAIVSGTHERLVELQLWLASRSGSGGTLADQALQVLSLQVDRQAALLAYGDVFRLVGLLFLAVIPLVLLLGKPPAVAPAPGRP
jgi:hypothetical protein